MGGFSSGGLFLIIVVHCCGFLCQSVRLLRERGFNARFPGKHRVSKQLLAELGARLDRVLCAEPVACAHSLLRDASLGIDDVAYERPTTCNPYTINEALVTRTCTT
eukprot:7389178-Prymnesium_polylepis.1